MLIETSQGFHQLSDISRMTSSASPVEPVSDEVFSFDDCGAMSG